MSTVPDATELLMLRTGVTDWMQTSVTVCTKAATKSSGGAKETITEGATVLGRVYSRTLVQPVVSGPLGLPAQTLLTAQFVEVPVATVLTTKDLVKIGGVYYDVISDASPVDAHRTLGNSYRIARMGVGS